MTDYAGILLRAVIIVVFASLVGLAVNLFSPKGIPWIYAVPLEVTVAGVKIPFIDEKKARELYDDGETVFLDTREEENYADGHIKGAHSLPAHEKEERFPAIQPLLTEEARIILYCSGPDCEMAETVAQLLVPLGYKNLMIMNRGFPAWKNAGYPVQGSIK